LPESSPGRKPGVGRPRGQSPGGAAEFHIPLPFTPDGLLRRAFRRLRFARRPVFNIEQMADRNRVQRLFEVNFRNTWIR